MKDIDTMWGWLARAYAIKEFAYMKQCEAESDDVVDESFETVKNDIRYVLGVAIDNDDRGTIRQCRKWINDFAR